MNVQELLRNISEKLSATATVKNVYGDSVAVGDRTVIPIAKISYAFGGGGGSKRGDQEAPDGGGGGGGGKVSAQPCGALEITAEGTRFVSFHDQRTILAALVTGFALGIVIVASTGSKRIEIVKQS